MDDGGVKNALVISIIFLFVGIAVAPSINHSVVTASQDDDLVEVTTQACGIKGYGDNKVKLTRQQYNDLEQYLVEFRARLNQTTTREEAIPLFKEAVVELDKYRLLPKGMSVERAQRFIINSHQNKRDMWLLNRLCNYFQNTSIGNIDNAFCLIAGKHSEAIFVHVLVNSLFVIMFRLYSKLYHQWEFIHNRILLNAFYNTLVDFYIGMLLIKVLGLIGLGTGIYFYSGLGNIVSIGLLGLKSWSGSIYGGFNKIPDVPDYGFLGVIGFTGFYITKIDTYAHSVNSYFIGSALAVSLDK